MKDKLYGGSIEMEGGTRRFDNIKRQASLKNVKRFSIFTFTASFPIIIIVFLVLRNSLGLFIFAILFFVLLSPLIPLIVYLDFHDSLLGLQLIETGIQFEYPWKSNSICWSDITEIESDNYTGLLKITTKDGNEIHIDFINKDVHEIIHKEWEEYMTNLG